MKNSLSVKTVRHSCNKSTLALAISAALSLGTHNLHAAVIDVSAGSVDQVDDANCSLVEALISANSNDNTAEDACVQGDDLNGGGDIIRLPDDSVFTLSTAPAVNIDSAITIQGQNVIVERDAAAPEFRLLDVVVGGDMSLDGLTLRNGSVTGDGGAIHSLGNLTLNNTTVTASSASGKGGGIFSQSGSVTLTHSHVTGNSSTDNGGGIYTNSGSLLLSDSTLSDNSSNQYGGGVHKRSGSFVVERSTVSGNSARRNGGGLYSRSTNITITDSVVSNNISNRQTGGVWARNRKITLTNSRLTGNVARISAAGMYGNAAEISSSTVSGNTAGDLGGGVYTTGNLTVTDSTISGNSATNKGGGIYHRNVMTITNSTVSGNTSNRGGGIYSRGGDTINMNNATVAFNYAADRGGGFFQRGIGGGTSYLNFSLIAANTSGGAAGTYDCFLNAGTIVDNNSWVGDNGCGDGVLFGDPLLEPLADNGGLTQTHALRDGSLAIDAGGACGQTADQRGLARVDNCDLGAFETTSLVLDIDLDTIAENDGASAASGTVSLLGDTVSAITVSLLSSDISEATVPATVIIPAGINPSVPFSIDAIDDAEIDGQQLVTITASTDGFGDASVVVNVTDDDDIDNDGVNAAIDNCPFTPNPDQSDFESDGIGDACDLDKDGDGMPNDYEIANGLNPMNSFDRDADPDRDGFTNLEEFRFGTNPMVPDPDDNNNGIPDTVEGQESEEIHMAPIIQLLLLDESR